jgi:hypothetical protein
MNRIVVACVPHHVGCSLQFTKDDLHMLFNYAHDLRVDIPRDKLKVRVWGSARYRAEGVSRPFPRSNFIPSVVALPSTGPHSRIRLLRAQHPDLTVVLGGHGASRRLRAQSLSGGSHFPSTILASRLFSKLMPRVSDISSDGLDVRKQRRIFGRHYQNDGMLF